ncbi:TPA: hypothetical protein ACX6RM_000894 [Photobacterium damselae]
MTENQQNALIYLSKINYALIQEYRFDSIYEELTPDKCSLLDKYTNAINDALTIFEAESSTLTNDEIRECIENSLSKCDFEESGQSRAKKAGKLQKCVNLALKNLKSDRPDFILYPAHSRIGLIPKGELTVIEIINPTDSHEYLEFKLQDSIENCLIKINNYHSFNKSKFISWSDDIRELFKGIIRLFSLILGHSDLRHALFFSQYETSVGWNKKSYISSNGILSNNESFGCVLTENKNFFEKIKSLNLVTVINSLTTQEFLDKTLAKNVLFAIHQFNRAIESHDHCEAVVNLCSSLEAIANQLYSGNYCKICGQKQVSKGLRGFLNKQAFIKHKNLYQQSSNPIKDFTKLYDLRSKVAHGSIDNNQIDALKTYMPKAISFVGTTLYILILNACTTKLNLPLKTIKC